LVPRTRQCIRSKPWWNETIDTAREIMKTRLREWKADSTTPKRNQFNGTRNNYHQTVRAEKNKVWYTFLFEARNWEIFQALRYSKPQRKEPTPDITFQGATATTFKEKPHYSARPSFLHHLSPKSGRLPTLPVTHYHGQRSQLTRSRMP
jgi:hypothetical protein